MYIYIYIYIYILDQITFQAVAMLQCVPTMGHIITFHFRSFEMKKKKSIHCNYEKICEKSILKHII